MFNEIILEHFRNPRNAGELPGATAQVEVSNPVCGDILRLSTRMEGTRIVEARFKTQGCVAAIAASSALTGMLAGKSLEQARAITALAISDSLGGLPPASFHAAQLCVDGIAALLRQAPAA
jgi:nitrogen fixation protein NifU and related proteins